MKKAILLFSGCLFAFFINAQSLSPSVIANSGDYYSNANLSVSWTMGEPVTETFANSNNTLTQGFQQSSYSYAAIEEYETDDFTIHLFPNPTTDIINFSIQTKSSENIIITLYDINGKELLKKQYSNAESTLSLKQFPSNILFLKIQSNNTLLKTYKIIKTE